MFVLLRVVLVLVRVDCLFVCVVLLCCSLLGCTIFDCVLFVLRVVCMVVDVSVFCLFCGVSFSFVCALGCVALFDYLVVCVVRLCCCICVVVDVCCVCFVLRLVCVALCLV